MKAIYILSVFFSLFLASCNSEPTLQKYFVEKSENKDFIVTDIAPSILNVDKTKLSLEQSKALASFEKINILAFKLDPSNKATYDGEKEKVKAILKDQKYQELMHFGSGKDGASVSFVGDENHIQEFVLFANRKENGFAVVRILGKDMNPNAMVEMMGALKNSNMNLEQLKPLQEMFLKK